MYLCDRALCFASRLFRRILAWSHDSGMRDQCLNPTLKMTISRVPLRPQMITRMRPLLNSPLPPAPPQVQTGLQTLELPSKADHVEGLFTVFDKNRDGVIHFAEFEKLALHRRSGIFLSYLHLREGIQMYGSILGTFGPSSGLLAIMVGTGKHVLRGGHGVCAFVLVVLRKRGTALLVVTIVRVKQTTTDVGRANQYQCTHVLFIVFVACCFLV